MSYEADLYTALTSDATLTALVGSRVSADFADSTEAKPYVVYQTITTGGETTHDATRNTEFPLIQISAWAEGKSAVVAIASAITDIIDGQTLAGDSDLSLVFEDRQSRYEQETNLYGEILDFRGSCNRN